MKRREAWVERLVQGLDLDSEPVPGVPLVEISGERRVLIEHHRGVTQYGKDRICVKVKYGHISVQGCGLELTQMTKEQIVICGRIDQISLCRRDQP